jgi:hypothetical protein
MQGGRGFRSNRFDVAREQGEGGERSDLLRPRPERGLRRTLSDPTGLALAYKANAALLDLAQGSPFEEALDLHQRARAEGEVASRKKKNRTRIARATYERKKKKGEITQEHEQYGNLLLHDAWHPVQRVTAQRQPIRLLPHGRRVPCLAARES